MNTQQLVIEAALRKMFRNGWVDICTIDAVAKMANIIPPREVYAQLRILHCVNFTDMDRELVARIPDMLAEVFTGCPFDVENVLSGFTLKPPQPPPPPGPRKVIDVTPFKHGGLLSFFK